jgi:WD40 repeat protein
MKMNSRFLKSCIFFVALTARILPALAQEWEGRAFPPSKQCVLRGEDSKEIDYASWISDYKKGPLKGGLNDGHKVQLTVTVIDGDDLKPARDDLPFSCIITTAISVSVEGMISMQRVTALAIQGGGPGQLPPEDLKVLRPLIASLSVHPPDDYSRLPPLGRRIVLQVRNGNKISARVYDRTDMPDSILEILGLTGATHGPLRLDFAPKLTGTLPEFGEQGIPPDAMGIRIQEPVDPIKKAVPSEFVILAISPDRSYIVKRYLWINPRTEITDAKNSTVVHIVQETTSDQRSISMHYASFTPDGRFLLLLSNLPAIFIYETKTWQQVDRLPGLPSGAVAYYPSWDWKHGVVVSENGSVSLWNAIEHRTLASLDLDGELQRVSFSPDDSRLAVTSARQNEDQSSTFHLRVWDSNTGGLKRELKSLYYFEHDLFGNPMWWENGKYLLAETREGHWGGYAVEIWNVEAGKLRGGFSGCEYSADPFDVALAGQRLFDRCRSGKLLMWDVGAAVDQIEQFEKSLSYGTELAIQHR